MTVLDELIVAVGTTREDLQSLERVAGTVLEMLGDRADLASQIGAESMAVQLRAGQDAAERAFMAISQTEDVSAELLSSAQEVSLHAISHEVLEALDRSRSFLDRVDSEFGTATQCVREAQEAVERVDLEEPLAAVQELSGDVETAAEGIAGVRKRFEATVAAVDELFKLQVAGASTTDDQNSSPPKA